MRLNLFVKLKYELRTIIVFVYIRYYNNNNNMLAYKAPVCQKTSEA